MIITRGRYAGHRGTVEANVYQNTVDYPDEWAMGTTSRWTQMSWLRSGGTR
ncbi:MAG: hypothetical protein IH963_11280 [Chloroflexi bacterium]|nr:hypothetical protein [Chloroflexota bacterium]